jgi:hypothetical protein
MNYKEASYADLKARAREIRESEAGAKYIGNYTQMSKDKLRKKIKSWDKKHRENGESTNPAADVASVPETYNTTSEVEVTLLEAISSIEKGIGQLKALACGPSLEELKSWSQEILINLEEDYDC